MTPDKARYLRGQSRFGWTPVWIADEHGCQLHTEPICTVPDVHAWLLDEIEKMPCIWSGLPLLHHDSAPTDVRILQAEDHERKQRILEGAEDQG